MIVGRYELEQFVDIASIKTETLLDRLNSIGLEVESFKRANIPQGVRIGFIKECEKHPNADKLSVCRVDVGEREPLTIVCGAKNVAKGQYVPVATIGTILSNGLEIKQAKLRGIDSFGMICSSSELGLVKINDGILVLDDSIGELKVGATLSGNRVLDDEFIELSITPNRGDCLSLYGICRDISAAFGVKLKAIEYKEKNDNVLGIGRTLQVVTHSKLSASLCYRMIEVKDSKTPVAIALALANNGALKESDIDNMCEYATYVCGVVINFYHASELNYEDAEHRKYSIEIKKEESSLEAVYGKKRVSIIGYDRDRDHKIQDRGEFVIEASYVEPHLISELVTNAKLKKDTKIYYKTSRGTNPDLIKGMNFFISLIDRYTKSVIYSGMHEFLEHKEQRMVTINTKKISSILGVEIERNQIYETLKALGFSIDTTVDSDTFVAKVPGFRADILSIQDVAEEILRIKGIDNIPSIKMEFKEENQMGLGYREYKKRERYRYRASMSGFSETLHYVFTSDKLQKSFNLPLIKEELALTNPITAELSTLRSSLLPNMIETVARNINNSQKRVSLYEIGKVFNEKREESEKIAFVFSGLENLEAFINKGAKEIDFFAFAKRVSYVLGEIELDRLDDKPSFLHPYVAASILKDGKNIGIMGALHPNIESKFSIPKTFVAEIDFESLSEKRVEVVPYSQLQPIFRDLSLLKDRMLEYKEIKSVIDSLNIELLKSYYPLDLYRDKEFGEKESLTIRFLIQPKDRALEDSEIASMMEHIIEALSSKLGIKLR